MEANLGRPEILTILLAYALFDNFNPICLANVARKVTNGPTKARFLGYWVFSSPTQGSSPTASLTFPDCEIFLFQAILRSLM